VGDWDGDGRDTLGVRRGNQVHVGDAAGRTVSSFAFGSVGDEVLVGDWDGDGRDTLAVRRGNEFHVANTLGGPAVLVTRFGRATDTVVAGDWDGDGRDSLGVHRLNEFHLQARLGSSSATLTRFGRAIDVPVVGDWNGDGRDTVGVRRETEFHATDAGGSQPRAGRSMRFGRVTDRAVVGDWNGDGLDSIGVRRGGYRPFSARITATSAAQLGQSWRPGCPVPPSGLRNVSVTYWGYDRAPKQGTLVVAASEASAVAAIFGDIYRAGFPIHKMYPSSMYGSSDDLNVQNDNTSAFLCRTVPGSTTISQHSYGLAVDINPLVNPWVYSGGVIPPEGAPYADRRQDAPGMIHGGDEVVRAFSARGWIWGGYWRSSKDYQHFSRNGR
jgi:hypothetical protein